MSLRQDHGRIGDRLRALARRLCTADTMDRIIDPLIADLQFEHAQSQRAGRPWRARWRLLAGYIAFWNTLGLQASRASARALTRTLSRDEHAIGRTIGFSAAIVAAFTLLLMVPPFFSVQSWRTDHAQPWLAKWSGVQLWVYLIPQAIPLAVVFGLPMGILVGLRRRQITRRVAASVLVFGLVCGTVTFVDSAWILPRANQAFRLLVSGRPSLARGANEMTLGELRARVSEWNANDRPLGGLSYAQSYYVRWAAPFAAIALGAFGLSLAAGQRPTWVSVGICVVATIVYFGYGALVVRGLPSRSLSWLPAWAAVWLPNAIFGALSLVLLTHSKAWASWRTPQSS
jgi:Lipopolysaccharide export system permease LptF/LptG